MLPANHGQPRVPVIMVMGRAGAGKGYFINKALGKNEAHVADSLECEARPPESFFCRDWPVYLVDTPGWDDTYHEDTSTLKGILDWFKDHGTEKMPNAKFGGILYLVEAGQHNLPMYHEFTQVAIVNDRFLVVGTKTVTGGKKRREIDLDFVDSTASAREIVKAVLAKSQDMTEVVLINCIEELEKLLERKPKKRRWGRLFARFSGLFKP